MQWTSKLPPYSFHVRAGSRRSFLATASLAVAACWSSQVFGVTGAAPAFSDYPFQLGVASGDPSQDGVVIWTRLAPKPLETGGGMPVEPVTVLWQVAEDEGMTRLVKSGEAVARPEWAHSVHVELEGLQPGRWYWYRFKVGGEISPVGRTRTMPAAGEGSQRLRFAFASCQHYESGFYTAYEHMAQEDLDLVIHLGDYIYEKSSSKTTPVRKHGDGTITTLDGYRRRHALYHTDPALQKMHQQVPWIVTWDDHETWNDMAGTTQRSDDQLRRRAAAYQAYYEHMPLRRSSLPTGPDMLLYRRLQFGDLADFFVLDTRQYRSLQPQGDLRKQVAQALEPGRTILGDAQRDWLFGGLRQSGAKWNVLAQQVMMAHVDRTEGPKVGYLMDKWDGYGAERAKVLKFLDEEKIRNPVVLTGDIHSNWANDLLADFDQPDSKGIATEFVGTSISSSGDGAAEPKALQSIYSENPFVKFHNKERGYVRCEVTPDQWRTDYRTVPYVTKPGAPVNTRASFIVESGRPALQKA